MASPQLLECPDCGHRHDVAGIRSDHFECAECGRALKLPAALREPALHDAQQGALHDAQQDALHTDVQPSVRSDAQGKAQPNALADPLADPLARTSPGDATRVSTRQGRTRPRRLGLGWRIGLWILAVPLGMMGVFGAALSRHWVSTNDLSTSFTETGWDRFKPIAGLVPVAAFVIALLVHFGAMGLERYFAVRRSRRSEGPTRVRPQHG